VAGRAAGAPAASPRDRCGDGHNPVPGARLDWRVIGHLLAFLIFVVVLGLFHLVAGHGMGIMPSLVVSVPCEVAGVVAGRSVKRWMRGG